jgi:hypothetical protein
MSKIQINNSTHLPSVLSRRKEPMEEGLLQVIVERIPSLLRERF